MRPLILAVVALFAQDSRPATQPADATSLNAEALRLVEAKRFDEALLTIERARKLAPSEEIIATNQARILTRRAQARFEAGDSEAAEADLVLALGVAPKEVISRVQLALILRTRGELDRARKEVQRALADEPSSAAAFEELARISYEEEDLIGAAEALETSIKLDPARKASLQAFRDKLEKEAKIESSWFRAVRGSFVVKYDDQKFKDVGETVLGYLDAAETRARETFGQTPSRGVTLILYGQQDFTATTGAHGWTGGLFDGKIRLPVRNFAETRDSIRRTIAHEYTHLVVRDLNRKCPVWLNEGLAQIAEEKSLKSARDVLRAQKEPRSVRSMPASWMGIQDARLVAELYAQGLLFTSWLVDSIGYQGIKDVLQKSNGTTTFEAAFAQVAGKTLEESEAEWRAAR
jgi:tetratricopeptide (TPR) repeat protein